jgi:hypothetical protein
MPDARRTRSFACEMKSPRAKSPQVHRVNPAFPARWFYGFLRAPGDRALLPLSFPRNNSAKA